MMDAAKNIEGRDADFMREALELARRAAAEDEVPVGAVVARGAELLGRGRDRKIALAAARALGDWRLEGCALYVTLEPCPMCAGAILLARVDRLVYGAPNHKFGALGTITDLLAEEHAWNHRVEVVSGCLAEECAELLQSYFAAKRQKKD